MKSTMLVASATLSAILAGPLQAATVIEDVTATASSWYTMPDETTAWQAPVNLVNNLGMDTPYDITADHETHGDAVNQWHALHWDEDPNPVLTFDLGGAFDLAGIHIWNGNQGRSGEDNTGRGVDEFVLSVSTDGTDFTTVGTYNLTRSPFEDNNTGPISAQNFDLTGHNGITHARIVVNSIHDPGNPYANLSEVMFTEVSDSGSEIFGLTRIEVTEDSVILTFPSEPGQVFDIYRSIDLLTGFDTPLAADLPAAVGAVLVDSWIDDYTGGLTLGDSAVDFDLTLTAGATYYFVPANGINAGREVGVVSWSGNTITVAEDVESDQTWSGFYEVRTPSPTETEWTDPARPEESAFYQVQRQ